MERLGYTADEVRLARRLLQDLELGRWPARRAHDVAGLHEPSTIAALYAAGEVLRALEHSIAAARPLLCPSNSLLPAAETTAA